MTHRMPTPNSPPLSGRRWNWLARSLALTIVLIALQSGSSFAAGLDALDPAWMAENSCTAGNNFPLTIYGNFGATAPSTGNTTVRWNGVGSPLNIFSISTSSVCTNFPVLTCSHVGSVTVDVPCANLVVPANLDFDTALIEVVVAGTTIGSFPFTVYASTVDTLSSTAVPAGGNGYAQTANNSTGTGGVVASFANTGSAATLTVANYAPNVAPVGVAFMPFNQNGGPTQAYDVQLVGTSLSGTLTLDFYYPASVGNVDLIQTFELQYYDPNNTSGPSHGWFAVQGVPGSNGTSAPWVELFPANDPLGSCCPSGGFFRVDLDGINSIPTLSHLTGTVFTMGQAPLAASPSTLWPPDHKMVNVTVDAPGFAIVSVTSNEPVSGLGGGDKSPDWQITGPLTLKLRAERGDSGNGRLYTIVLHAEDGSQNIAVVQVPQDQREHEEDHDKDHDDRGEQGGGKDKAGKNKDRH